MHILPYQLATTNDLLTSRAGLVCIGQLLSKIGFTDCVNQHFPGPKSNRGFQPATFVTALVLMLHEGGRCLDDLRHLQDDEALRYLMGLNDMPQPGSMGDWLRRLGQTGVDALVPVNRAILRRTLQQCRSVTLDIDATLSASKNQEAEWTYKKCTGYMPMAGHIAETGQVVAIDFRAGNVAPATNNLEFVHQCEAALPDGVRVKALRADAASYQVAILDECMERQIQFAIRAKMNKALKELITQQDEANWQPLRDQQGKPVEHESTCRLVHSMEKSTHAFTVIVQRRLIEGQSTLDLQDEPSTEVIASGAYLYRAIATNKTDWTDSDGVHWYNQRGEHSENRIKELKADFGAGRVPCRDFDANALYFSLCMIAYNLFALLRAFLPASLESARAKTVRWRLYALAGKVVKHGRKVYLKLKAAHRDLVLTVQQSLCQLAQAP